MNQQHRWHIPFHAVWLLLPCFAGRGTAQAPPAPSHEPLRRAPAPSKRPWASGPAYFVDAEKGDDKQAGTKQAPWRTIRRGLEQLRAGDTLYLRGGTYYEHVHLCLSGRQDAPITVASFPGEQAIIDGGLREFFESPGTMWEPWKTGGAGEYRSTRRYPNLRNFVGAFGDSMIGLNTYYHARDLRATIEHIEQETDKSDVKSIYCGPGLWYDRASGHVHVRLAPTTLKGFDNYRGPQDPRKLPLVIAPFRSVPLHLDKAEHVRLQDLTIRGGGHDTVVLDQASDVVLDQLTIWCGTFGVRLTGTRGLKMHRCGVHGNAPPWATRFEAGFNTYPGRTQRDITRQNTHALLIAQGNREYEVYAFPFNDDWEIDHCEFTDAGADGLYLGGVNLKFHHNLVDNTRDDGIYLSPMYPRHAFLRSGAKIEIYQNHFSRCLTMLAFGGTETTKDTVWFYRNIVDMRAPVLQTRPTTRDGTIPPYMGHLMGDHGSPPWSEMYTYHNTIVVASPARSAHLALLSGATAERPRRVFNNILVHGSSLPIFQPPDPVAARSDANLYWQPGLDAKRAATYFSSYRSGAAFQASKKTYAPGFDAHSLAADPRFASASFDFRSVNDYRLQPGSPAIDGGVELPAEWPDPLRRRDRGKPDLGALPEGIEAPQVGRSAP